MQRSVTASKTGWVDRAARRQGAGDWDLAIFDAGNGDLIAGSSSFGGDEVASGMVTGGRRLTVQACRLSGSARSATLDVELDGIDTSVKPERLSLVRVATADARPQAPALGPWPRPDRARGRRLRGGGARTAPPTRRSCATTSSSTPTEIRDLGAQTVRDRAADAALRPARARIRASRAARTTYRRINDYGDDMKKLVSDNPTLVKPIVASVQDVDGPHRRGHRDHDRRERPRRQARLRADGRPPRSRVALVRARDRVGLRARQRLPSGRRPYSQPRVEHPHDRDPDRQPRGLQHLAGGRRGGGRRRRPRRAGRDPQPGRPLRVPAQELPRGEPPGRRPATRRLQPAARDRPAAVRRRPEPQLRRLLGRPGASAPGGNPPGDYAQNYRGPGPFSEPETQNIRRPPGQAGR